MCLKNNFILEYFCLFFRTNTGTEERMNLPLFIFECPFDSMKAVPIAAEDYDNDVLQDYSDALCESAIIPRHMNQKLPENKSHAITNYCQVTKNNYLC